MEDKHEIHGKATPIGVLIALGIIYGDIGTSPLYVMNAIIGKEAINETLVYGGLSCIFWTLTLQTTLKYVILTLQADNNGEGGILSLYALVRRHFKWMTAFAIIGGSTLLADGIITPPISVSSAIEGLRIIYPEINTVPIVLAILTFLFAFQIFGTGVVGRTFGPFMFIWFSMLAILGGYNIVDNPKILAALNPYYAYQMLTSSNGGFWILGSVFLCTTGAEALYSDMGHCGRDNVRVSWTFVKTCLLVNYFGQGAYLLNHVGQPLEINPFYGVMPDWFLIAGIAIATMAAIIASQALISGSYTLISEAVRLNFWPKVRLVYPSNVRGQLYVPSINILLWVGCILVVWYFKESSAMEAAYGLAITITMLMTTILLAAYLYMRRVSKWIIAVVFVLYLSIELSFLTANLVKFMHGGYVSLMISVLLIAIMWVWKEANEIKSRLTEYNNLDEYIPQIRELSVDTSVPKYATHLVYMTSANNPREVESKIIYSIFRQRPKRADIYWFIHVDITDDPYTMDYKVDVLSPDDVVRINFTLGFRVEQRIGMFFKKVIEDMVKNKEVDIMSRYESLRGGNVIGDFRFVVLNKFLSYENDLPVYEKAIMGVYFFIKRFTTTERQWFGLDANAVKIEKMPLVINPTNRCELRRVR
ncbi:KUP system potassium uptake protein [Flexibacter flexilis DSM 6793]|uniref:Probable potassium transport system protein Kup n=1 Tax=Flexibacter flexilis DSM 6793 TaxID=927664 RepID=A0A1I1GZ88_9BACT|nr:KUP/HAK/KT family potassium transporter [Flexibacter flexilis]SFC14483.1 KUP system potassium uptake protein [Flexibacter flexilis DSM 6793]